MSIICWASPACIAIGFSQITCLPAFSASRVRRLWLMLGVQTLTASIAPTASSFSAELNHWGILCFSAEALARSGRMSQTATSSTWGSFW